MTTNLSSASSPTTPLDHGEFCRYLAKIVIQLVSAALKDNPQREWYFMFNHDLGAFAEKALRNKYPWSYVKRIVELHVELNQFWPCITYEELHGLYPCEVLSDSSALEEICVRVIEAQQQAVQDYKKGKLAAMNRLKGLVMKETKGKADITKVEEILKAKMS